MRTKYYFTIMKEYKWEITYPRIIDFKIGQLEVSQRLPHLTMLRGYDKAKWIDLVFERHLSLLMIFPKDFEGNKYS